MWTRSIETTIISRYRCLIEITRLCKSFVLVKSIIISNAIGQANDNIVNLRAVSEMIVIYSLKIILNRFIFDVELIWQFWHKRKDVLMCDKGHVMDGPKILPHSKWHCVNSEMFGPGGIRLEDWNREREFLIDKDLPQYECYSCETCDMYLCDK